MYHEMHLQTLQFFTHLHALLASTSLYTLDEDKLLEQNVVKRI